MTDVKRMTQAQRVMLSNALEQEQLRRMEGRPADFFPWHTQQEQIFELPKLVLDQGREVRIIMAIGGNGSGKSKVGGGLISKIIRREHPLFYQFKTVDRLTGEIRNKRKEDPIRIWAVPPTGEKLRQDIWDPLDGLGLPAWVGPDLMADGYPKTHPDYVIKTKYNDEIFGKTQEQSLLTFEASEVDIIWFDEEPLDVKMFTSCLLRLRATHGFILLTFTPLFGLTWSYERIFKPLVIQGRAQRMADRAWIHTPEKGRNVIVVQMGTRDNPIAAEYAEEIEYDPEMSDAEKRARLYGEYGYVEGALLPRLSGLDLDEPHPDQKVYVVDRLPGQLDRKTGERVPGSIRRWLLVADPNKSFGAVLACVDQDGNLFFVTEHLEVNWADAQHAKAFLEIEREYGAKGLTERYADYGGAGAHSQNNLAYHGVPFQNVQKGPGSVSESIKRLRGMTWIDPEHTHPITGEKGAPRVYFYQPGLVQVRDGVRRSRLAEQLSQARQSDKPGDPPDTPHKDVKNRLDLFDVARYAAIIASIGVVPEGPEKQPGVHDRATRLYVNPYKDETEGRDPLAVDFVVPTYGLPQ